MKTRISATSESKKHERSARPTLSVCILSLHVNKLNNASSEHWLSGLLLKIVELRDGMRRIDIEGEITEIPEPRSVNLRTGGQARVADCNLKDDSGSIKLSLWDDQIDAVQVGSNVKIENGYTNSFQGEVRLNVGRYGKLQVV